jgi:2,3,4,5-tetrahydropyridine-2,6-dicarboxylate N-succinyltransferase
MYPLLIFAVLSRKHSSAGSEHLPYKQRVRGSNPCASTPKVSEFGDFFTLWRSCLARLYYFRQHKHISYQMELQQMIEAAYANRELLKEEQYKDAVRAVIEDVDKGRLRVAVPTDSGWQVQQWVKQAILLYFGIQPMQTWTLEPFEFYDKMLLKKNYAGLGVRAVPHAVARYGAYIAKNVVLMPSYVNIGAYVDEGTMVDTWATVGSCAQIGKGVHLSGGVGIGGVLEPLQAGPVIIEDGCFIGSRCIVVEGVVVEKEAVLGANVVLTQSTKIIDVSGPEPVEYKGRVPARSVVIPGSYAKKFPAGEYHVNCALIIGKRKESTDQKTSLNDALRDFGVSV